MVFLFSLQMIVSAAAAQGSLPVTAAAAGQLKIDGALGDWRGARFVRVAEDPAGTAEVALAYDAQGLFIAARVRDDVFVRSKLLSARDDALVAELAFPRGGQFVASELWLFAGRSGESAARAALRNRGTLSVLRGGTQIVEGPENGGYALEAFVPWASFPGGADWAFARGRFRLHDVDDAKSGDARGGSGSASPLTAASLPWLAFDGGALPAVTEFLRNRSLSAAPPRLDRIADVTGDARGERVLVVGTVVIVVAPGGQFQFAELPAPSAADVLEAELLDATGDGKAELVSRIRLRTGAGTRERVYIHSLDRAPTTLLAIDAGFESAEGLATAQIELAPRAGPKRIKVEPDQVRGFSPERAPPASSPDVVPLALPWASWQQRIYAWDGRRFGLLEERANPHAAGPPPPPSAASERLAAKPDAVVAPAAADPEAALDQYRRERGISPDSPGRFAQRANVLGDARPESLAVFGRELVVWGAGSGAQAAFVYLGMPVNDPPDLLEIRTADLTGDGRHEVVARVRQRIGDVEREILYCYTISGARPNQLAAIEVARARGAQRIDNKWSFATDKQAAVLTILPGSARGWSASDYPFVAESMDGIAPLLLPWRDRPTRYVFERERLVAKPKTSD